MLVGEMILAVEQAKSSEWLEQWQKYSDDHRFLFEDWIKPATLESFAGKRVLECGCGGGHHTKLLALFAEHVTAVDLNCADLARERCRDLDNVEFVDADLAKMCLDQQYDVVLCIGVIHHTDDPDATFSNLLAHCKSGGRVIIWTYSAEGNGMVRWGVEPIRKVFLRHFSRRTLDIVARLITVILYPIVYTVYRLPLKWLPYWQYFGNFRRLSFERNALNVFDKLNAPQTHFTTRKTAIKWMNEISFEPSSISISSYVGVSWRLSGVKRSAVPSSK